VSALSTEAGLLNLLEGIRLSGPSTLLLASSDVTGEGSDDYDVSGVVESDYDEREVKMRSDGGEGEAVAGSDDVRGMVEGSDGEEGVKDSAGYDYISSETDDNGGRGNGESKISGSSHSNSQQHCNTHNSSSSSSNNNSSISNINNYTNNSSSNNSSSSINISGSSSSGNISDNNKCRVEVNTTETKCTERKSHSDISVVSSIDNIEIGSESRNSSEECASKQTAHEVGKGVGRKEDKETEDKGEDEVSRYEERKAKKELYKQKQQKGQNSHKNGNKLGAKSSGLDANSDDFRVGGMLGRGKGMKAGFQISQVRGLYDDDEEEEGQGEGGEGGVVVGKVRRKGVIYFVPRSNGVAAAATVTAVTEPPLSQGEAGERTCGVERGAGGGGGAGGSVEGLHTNEYSQSALSLSNPVQGGGGGEGCGGGAGEDGDVIGGEVPGLGFLSYIADSEDGVMRACALRTIVVS
jgi:hypothetical protein